MHNKTLNVTDLIAYILLQNMTHHHAVTTTSKRQLKMIVKTLGHHILRLNSASM